MVKIKLDSIHDGEPHLMLKNNHFDIDLKSVCSIDHECVGCSTITDSCCAKYDVTVNEGELKRIIPAMPDVAKLCPHLKTADGYANVFEESDDGLYSIDTHDNDLCVFAYRTKGLIRCSLQTVEMNLGLPLGSLKPAVCILYPLTFSENGKVLKLHHDALACACSSPRSKPSDVISPALLETIRHFGGEIPVSPS
jgi:hypothetical protein